LKAIDPGLTLNLKRLLSYNGDVTVILKKKQSNKHESINFFSFSFSFILGFGNVF